MKYRNKHWRVVRSSSWSFHADCLLFHAEYKGIFGFWRGVPNPGWIGPIGFASNEDAVDWINEREPISIIESFLPPMKKSADWNDLELASGRYGQEKANQALIRLATRTREERGL